MATLTDFQGLQVLEGTVTGAGGEAIHDNFVSLVSWHPKSLMNESTSPDVGDDVDDDFYPGSLWFQTNTTPPRLYVCQSSAAGAAVWLTLVQSDPTPKLGGNLDVNGHKLVGGVDIGSSSSDPVTLTSNSVSIPNGLIFTRQAIASTAEFIQGWKMSDDSESSVSLSNATSAADQFAPKFLGFQKSTHVALNFTGQSKAGNDSGLNPYVLFVFQNWDLDVETRPGVEFRNRATTLWQLMGDGSIKRFNKSTTREIDQLVASVSTTDATQTVAKSITIASGNTYLIEARIIARRSSNDDGASYVRRGTYTTKSGTVTLMGSVQTIGTDAEDQAGWDATLAINGSAVEVRVTGADSHDVTWFVDVSVQRVAS